MVRRRKESQKSYLQNCQDGPAPYIVVCTLSSTWLLCTAHAYTHTQCIATMYYSLHSIEMSRRKRNTRLHIQFVPRVGSCIMYARMAGWQPRDWLVYARAGVYLTCASLYCTFRPISPTAATVQWARRSGFMA